MMDGKGSKMLNDYINASLMKRKINSTPAVSVDEPPDDGDFGKAVYEMQRGMANKNISMGRLLKEWKAPSPVPVRR